MKKEEMLNFVWRGLSTSRAKPSGQQKHPLVVPLVVFLSDFVFICSCMYLVKQISPFQHVTMSLCFCFFCCCVFILFLGWLFYSLLFTTTDSCTPQEIAVWNITSLAPTFRSKILLKFFFNPLSIRLEWGSVSFKDKLLYNDQSFCIFW